MKRCLHPGHSLSIELAFGVALEQARKARRLTIEQVSNVTGISPILITEYENGTQRPLAQHVVSLAVELETSVSYLFGLLSNLSD